MGATEEEKQVSDEDVKVLHTRINILTEKNSENSKEVVSKLNEIATNVAIIKRTCDMRGTVCAKRVSEMDETLRGNGKSGLLSRVNNLESQRAGKDKFVFLIIGVLATGAISFLVSAIANLTR